MEIRNNGLFINNIGANQNKQKTINEAPTTNSFEALLNENTIRFSKHAFGRLEQRNINLSTTQMQRVQQGVDEAKKKGIKESLVLVDDVALVVSIKNNVIITATKNENTKNIFTNIDGAVIV